MCAAIETVVGAADEAHGGLAAREPDRLAMALHLHRRAPFIGIPHHDAHVRVADARVQELVAAPRVGGIDRTQALAGADDGVCKTPGCGREHGRTAAAVTLRPDARFVDFGQG